MKDAVLIIAVLGVFIFGYFLMAKLDKFLDENQKAIKEENQKKEPSGIMLYGSTDTELSKSMK